MKFFAFFAMVAVSGFANVIEVGPIPITGGGSFVCFANPTDGGEDCSFNMSFSGSNGFDSVFFSASGSLPGAPEFFEGGPVFLGSPQGGTVIIDSIISDTFQVNCCNSGVGFLEAFDDANIPATLALATLTGTVIDTILSSSPGIFGGINESDSFVIVSAPEPGSAVLMLIGAGVFGACLRTRLAQLAHARRE
jgi:hypothetical protein